MMKKIRHPSCALKRLKRMAQLLALVATCVVSASAPASAAQGQPIELRLALFLPSNGTIVRNSFEPWINELNEAGEGLFYITWYKASTVGSQKTVYQNVVNGVIDIGMIVPTAAFGRFPQNGVANIPLFDRNLTSEAASVAIWRMYEQGRLEGFEEVRPLIMTVMPESPILTTKNVDALNDFRGLKIGGTSTAPYTKALGAAPLAGVSVIDTYQFMQRGVMDGYTMTWPGIYEYRLYEVARQASLVGLVGGQNAVVINRKTFDALPQAAKDILLKHSGEERSRAVGRMYDGMVAMATEKLRENEIEIVEFTSTDGDILHERLDRTIESQLEDIPGGREIFEAYLDEFDRASAMVEQPE